MKADGTGKQMEPGKQMERGNGWNLEADGTGKVNRN